MEAGLVFAFAGGVLGLFSPCNALLLPAFFAHAASSTRRLWVLGLAFLAGMLATLVPLGLGIGWLGGFLAVDRRLLMLISAWVIVALGVVQVLGGGFDLSRLLPWRRRQARGGASASVAGAVLLGTVAGVAGFCTGPVLGAILTLVLAGGSALGGGMLLASYALGMIIPVLLAAALIRRTGGFKMGWLKGRSLRVGPLRLHTNHLLAGSLTIVVGIVMLSTGGLVTAPEMISTSMMEQISAATARIDAAIPGWAWPALLGLGLLSWWVRVIRRRSRCGGGSHEAQSRNPMKASQR
ncbi:cytochrome c biogenesis CcdA family protein [Arthrobacter sp.]|uniref:cytochrome c biogenesis CcdA family protein n=1 Tax=Arthrobacter sp. TaxID=1667 RepID=UPI003A8EC9FA